MSWGLSFAMTLSVLAPLSLEVLLVVFREDRRPQGRARIFAGQEDTELCPEITMTLLVVAHGLCYGFADNWW